MKTYVLLHFEHKNVIEHRFSWNKCQVHNGKITQGVSKKVSIINFNSDRTITLILSLILLYLSKI